MPEKEGVRVSYVDLDKTLLCIDLLRDRLITSLFHEPLKLFQVLSWLFRGGRARLKTEFASRHPIDPSNLPFNSELLSFLRIKKEAGFSLVLASAAAYPWAEAVAAHLGIFDRVLATTPESGNLKGERKLESILADAKGRPFAYAGDAKADLPLFEAAEWPIVVGSEAKLAGANAAKALSIPRLNANAHAWWKALRTHQWSKNMLVFVPALSSHQFLNLLPEVLLAFGGFCCLASALYVLNDLYDIDLDRKHPDKRLRAIAAGQLDSLAAVGLFVLLLGLAAGFCIFLPSVYFFVLLSYAVTNILYSKWAQKIVVLDVIVLAFLYGIRTFAGGAACNIEISPWLAALTFFLALSLAHLKRYVETTMLQRSGVANTRPAYLGEDALWLGTAGIAAGLISVLILALYITSPQTYSLYRTPQLLYLICMLQFYWIERVWVLAYRGKMLSDPVEFMVKDRISYLLAILVLAISDFAWAY